MVPVRRLTEFVLIFALFASAQAAHGAEAVSRITLQQDWQIQSSAKVSEAGDAISTAKFQPRDWYTATVPGTVLANLVADKVYPDPYFGSNLRSIPGASYPVAANFANLEMPADSPFKSSWWYRTEFKLPAAFRGKYLWLRFNGLNYRANVWLNGTKIADSVPTAGMWRIFEFNITPAARAGETNVLAVEVIPPTPDSLSITWVDWNPMPPDKDMGLWRSVSIAATGPVLLRNPQVVTKLDLPSLETAHLTLSASLQNASQEPVQGKLKAKVGDIGVEQDVQLAAGESKVVTFDPARFPSLDVSHPRIWWPAQMGKPELYNLKVEVAAAGHTSDEAESQFGIREVTSVLDDDKHRVFSVNGKRLLVRGGGWSPDMMLREDPVREEEEIRYTRDMGLNAIRSEGKLVDDNLFDLTDRYGIVVLAGWCCCDHWEKWRSWKDEDYDIAAESLRSQLRRLRNHPSLLVWLYGSDNPPPPKVETIYLGIIKDENWPNPFVSSATARPTTIGPSGVKMTGPYDYVPPSYWLEDSKAGGAYGFNTETSPGPAIPVLASLREMLPPDKLWPVNDVWGLHAGGGQFRNLTIFNRAMDESYGKPSGLEDYVEKAQVMAYAGERAMFEAYSQNKYHSTGVIQWMENNAWPSIIWHLYDWYLRPGGGYFGTKLACQPVHIQYSPPNDSIVVVSSAYQPYSGLKAKVQVLNLDLTEKFTRDTTLDMDPDATRTLFALPAIEGLSKTYFLKLELSDASGHVLSRNFYWLSTHRDASDFGQSTWFTTPQSEYADYTGLATLPRVQVHASAKNGTAGQEEYTRVTLHNPGTSLAFFVHLEIYKGKSGDDVRPIRWEDNYITLMPGETRQVEARYAAAALGGAKPVVHIDGWNVEASGQ